MNIEAWSNDKYYIERILLKESTIIITYLKYATEENSEPSNV